MKKLLLVFLCLCLLFGAGCKEKSENSSQSLQLDENGNYKDFMTLLFSEADSFNPYEAKTDVNRQICLLLYESLIKTDNEFNAVNRIAESVKTEGKVCTVKLKNIKFSDGTPLTADDVVHSFNLAKQSAVDYGKKLYEVDSIIAENKNTVIFNLTVCDPYFKNLLDFPILKMGSESITDSDSVKLPPIGCGRYTVSKDRKSLIINDNYFGKKGDIKQIRLINAPDNESISHYVEIGVADMYYSNIADGNILRMSGQKFDINLNNLVYLGVNLNSGDLALRQLRQAISSGIDREKICKDTYYNNALPATGFFNPSFADTKSVQNLQINSNSQITVENLKEIGYNSLDKEGFYRKNGGALRFSLIVNKENRIRVNVAHEISRQLEKLGIKLTVNELSYENYIQRLQNGDFQFYLAEVNITENMDMRPLISNGGALAFGIRNTESEEAQSNSFSQIMNKFYNEQASVVDVETVLQTDMPIIPICYRTGILFCNNNIKNISNSSKSDIYFSIEAYKFKLN